KYDVKAKTYASGKLKGMLNPFEPGTPEGEAKAQALVDELGRQFETLLKERRGKKLTEALDTYVTGEVWGGQDALGLGLVDSNGTIETIMAAHPDLKLLNFGPFERKNNLLPSWLQTLDDTAQALQTLASAAKGELPR
ncbi:MAG: S49 family peptidase, partial [Burkholderiales bacterium]|nr:S49 family peptidase [Burkholderiales bacterium]